MLLPFLAICNCFWSSQDFKNEVEVQVYLLNKQIEHFASQENYNPDFWYAKGKFDVYKSFQNSLNQESPIKSDTNN